MAINKIIYGGNTLIDLTADTVDVSHLLDGYTAHDKSGAVITGECTFDADTSDANALRAEILLNRTAYVNGVKLTGSMPNNGAVTGTISDASQQYTIAQGYHDGSGKVGLDSVEISKIIPNNIKAGIEILGVIGTYSGEAVSVQAKTATPNMTTQTILPDPNYDYLSQVTVNPIPYVETANQYGITVTIG